MKSYLRAYLWWCGDDICNCYQPKIEKLTPKKHGHLTWYNIEELWAGSFHPEPEIQEMQDMVLELQAKAKEYNITLNEYYSGHRTEE